MLNTSFKYGHFFVFRFILLPIVMSFFFSGISQAQNYELIRKKLRQEQNQTRSEIEDLKKQLLVYEEEINETNLKFEELTVELAKIEKEVSIRQEVISKLQNESKSILEEIRITTSELNKKEEELEKLIQNYKDVLTYLYKHGRTSEIAIIIAAENLNQMMNRSYYLKKFGEYRKAQTDEIELRKIELEEKRVELNSIKQKNEETLAEQNQQKKTLDVKQKRQKNLISKIRRSRKKLNTLFVTTKKEINNLNNTLEKLIAEEIRIRKAEEERLLALEKERLRRLEEAKKIVDANKRREEIAKYEKPIKDLKKITLSEQEITEIESSFNKSKGKLPWPVETGVITAKFGNIVHPVYRTKVRNYGVEIATDPGSNVYAIHDGIVFGVVPIPGYGDVVIVNHGKFNSVYGNLSEVLVGKNMIIKSGDLIGKSGDDKSPKGNAVFLMIREEKKNLNPERWIVKK